MKKIYCYLLFILAIGTSIFVSCNDFLDQPPLNRLSNNEIFGSESGVQAYMSTLYNRLPIEDFNYGSESGFNNWVAGCFMPAMNCDEAIHAEWPHEIFGPNGNNMWNRWWAYDNVRNVNTFIREIEKSTLFNEQRKSELLGEGYAIRAWYYFGMAKRYGGLPLIKEPQEYDPNNLSALNVPRSTEEETYNFILEDLDKAIELLPVTQNASEKNRINRYAAQALKSRAMLYAGSIAKYGTYDKNGLVGFDDKTKANKYFEEVIKAASDIIESGSYSLYRGSSDLAKSYQQMFWIKDDCPEVIFVKKYLYPGKAHNWDLWQQPWGYRYPEGYGSRLSPTMELVESYRMTDGSTKVFRTNTQGWILDDSGKILEVDDRTELFNGRDARLYATISIPGAKWSNAKGDVSGIIDVYKGIVEKTGENVVILKEGGAFTDTYDYNGEPIYVIGRQGIGGTSESTGTGFYIKKFLYEGTCPREMVHDGSDQDWMEFRYAEILLNYAEAAVELGNSSYRSKAIAYLNDLRDRAGVAPATAIDVDMVRQERRVELMFESHRFWDIKRWRIGDKVMNNVKLKGLHPYYVANTGKWIFKKLEVGNIHDYKPYMNYIRITDGDLNSSNPPLIQNPGY